MRASLKLSRAQPRAALVMAVAFALSAGCAKKSRSVERAGSTALATLPDLPEPAGVLGELSIARPDATFRTLRELGRPLSALLPAGFPMLTATLLGLPPLSADSFDPALPVVGLLLQPGSSTPTWLLAVHCVSGPELIAKLTTGDRAPFRAQPSSAAGLKLVEPSVPSGKGSPPALAVFDNYLLIAERAESLVTAGPYAARMLPKRPAAAAAAVSLRFSHTSLESKLVPALRGVWAAYRTRLAHQDLTDRSAHGGRAPDFADPAQVILGADALVESVLGLLDSADSLELGLQPFEDRLDATLQLEPGANSQLRARLAALAESDAQTLLGLPAETQLALGLSRTSEERTVAGDTAGDDWVRVLGGRLTERDARQLRSVLQDFELGRGTETWLGFLSGNQSAAFLAANVAEPARLKRAGSGFFGLFALPSLRAPISEFLGEPRVSEPTAPTDSLPGVSRRRLTFTARPGKPALPPVSFAWSIDERRALVAAGKNADASLRLISEAALGKHETLRSKAGIAEAVERIGQKAALFAYVDARVVFNDDGDNTTASAPLLISLGKRGPGAAFRFEFTKSALDLALESAFGH